MREAAREALARRGGAGELRLCWRTVPARRSETTGGAMPMLGSRLKLAAPIVALLGVGGCVPRRAPLVQASVHMHGTAGPWFGAHLPRRCLSCISDLKAAQLLFPASQP